MNRRLNYKWKVFVSFSVLLFIIISIVGATLYVNIANMMERQYIESNRNTLTQLKNSADITLQEVDRSLMQVVFDSNIQTFMDTYDESTYRDKALTLERVDNILSSNQYFDSVYVYYYGYDTILDPSLGVKKLNDFKDRDLIDYAINAYNARKDIIVLHPNNGIPAKNLLTIVKPIPIISDMPKALLIASLDTSYFDDIMKSININSNARVFVLNKDGTILSHGDLWSSKDIKGTDCIRNIQSTAEGSSIYKISGKEMLVSHVTSKDYGLKYVYILPVQIILDKIAFVKKYIILISLICLGLGFGLAYALTNRLYIPIYRLSTLFKHNEDNRIVDDIEYINNNIKNLISQNDSLEKMLEDNKPILKNAFLVSLLKGEIDAEESLWEKMDYHNVVLDKNGYYVIGVISIDNYDDMSAKYSGKQISMLRVYQKDLIKRLLSENPEIKYEIVDLSMEEMALILSFKQLSGKSHEMLSLLIEKLHKSISENMKYTTTIGIGNIYDNIENLNVSYREAVNAINNRILQGNDSVIFYSDIKTANIVDYQYPLDIEQKILNKLKQGNSKGFQCDLRDFLNKIQDKSKNSKICVRYASIQLFNSTIHYVYEAGIPLTGILDENSYDSLLNKKTPEDIINFFEQLYKSILDYRVKQDKNKHEELIKTITEYIENNYNVPEISLDLLSEKVHYSVPYMSKIFKEYTGKTFKKYVTEIRLLKAQELLKSTSCTVNKIGEKIGYPNVRAFIKMFKNYTGMTPEKYRIYTANKGLQMELGSTNEE